MSLIINFGALISGQVWEVFHVQGVKSLIKFCSKGTVALPRKQELAICSNAAVVLFTDDKKITIRLNTDLWQ